MPTGLNQLETRLNSLVDSMGRSKGTILDKYGANLDAAPLPGQGHQALYNKLQAILKSMMKLGGIHAERGAVNFLLDKVGEPYITRYVSHVSTCPNA